MGSEPEVAQKDDESDLEEVLAPVASGEDALRDIPSLWDELPGGASFGTLVHSALEELKKNIVNGRREEIIGALRQHLKDIRTRRAANDHMDAPFLWRHPHRMSLSPCPAQWELRSRQAATRAAALSSAFVSACSSWRSAAANIR